MKSVVFIVSIVLIMLGGIGVAKSQPSDSNNAVKGPTGCTLFAAVAKGVTLARDNGVDENEAARRAINVVSTNDVGRRMLLETVQLIYEDRSTANLTPDDVKRITFAACMTNGK